MDAVNFLIYPFLGCLLLILIHAYFGIHILERGIIFLDLSMAQFIALGISISFFMGYGEAGRFICSVVFAVIGALILSNSRAISRFVNIEAFIGVFYIFSLALSILILDRTPHGLEELKAMLSGNILWVTGAGFLKMLLLYPAIGLFHFIFRRKFFSLSFDGKGGWAWEFLFFLSFALVLVSSVATAGVLQVFSFLVIPALIGRLFTKQPLKTLLIGWTAGLFASAFGLIASYKLDLPAAPLFIAFLSIVFFMLLALKTLKAR